MCTSFRIDTNWKLALRRLKFEFITKYVDLHMKRSHLADGSMEGCGNLSYGANSLWNVGPTFHTSFGVGVNSAIVDSFACQTCWYNKFVQHSNNLV
jgi:hypothetical protein